MIFTYRKVAQIILMNSRFQARPLPGQAFFSFVLESKRGTSLKLKNFFPDVISTCIINDNSKHIFTSPNPLIVHGALR